MQVVSTWADQLVSRTVQALEKLPVDQSTILLDQGLAVMGPSWYSTVLEKRMMQSLKTQIITMNRPESLETTRGESQSR